MLTVELLWWREIVEVVDPSCLLLESQPAIAVGCGAVSAGEPSPVYNASYEQETMDDIPTPHAASLGEFVRWIFDLRGKLVPELSPLM